jgi:outer membrane protein assembly factor BamE
MSRRQVRFILGTPLLEDPFHQDRWDYPYVLRNGNNILAEARLMVYFDGDALVKFEGDFEQGGGSNDGMPEDAPEDSSS